MGICTEGSAQEKDFSPEETIQIFGRKGYEGCDGTEYMFCMWTYQEGASIVPILREGFVSKFLVDIVTKSVTELKAYLSRKRGPYAGKPQQKTTAEKPEEP